MHILYISHSNALGGAEYSLYHLVTSITSERWQPCVVVPSNGPLVEILSQAGIHTLVAPMPAWRQVRNLLQRQHAANRLASHFSHVDLVHCNTIWSVPYARAIAQRRHVPWITHVRDLVSVGQVRKYGLADAHAVISISNAVRQPLLNAGLTDSQTIYNGVDLRPFEQAMPASLEPKGRPRVGILGQVVPGCRWKGYETFIEAARNVCGDAHFFVIGGDTRPPETKGHGDYLRSLVQLADSLGVADRVTFTGFRTDVPSVVKALDIVVNASWAEPFGRTIIEAMAAKKPVIGTNAGGAPEIIADGTTGILMPPKDAGALARSIDYLLQHEDLRVTMGEAGYQRAIRHFSLRSHVEQVEAVYEAVLSAGDGHV